MYHYCGFGLLIASEIEFIELSPATFERADIHINLGQIPDFPGQNTFVSGDFSYTIADNMLFFEANGVGRYLAKNGNLILVEPSTLITSLRILRLFVLGTVMAALLLQRRQLPMHASAVLKNKSLFLIAGDSGAGKSTALAGLVKKGFTIFSDDVVVLCRSALGIASYPMIKLWEDAQKKLNDERFENKSFIIKPGMNKFGVFFHEAFDTASYPVNKMVILKKQDTEKIIARELSKSEAFIEICKQIYRPAFVHNNELRALVFQTVSDLANSAEIYEIVRPALSDIDSLVDQVEYLINS